ERYHTHVKGDEVYGRFGLKARVATLDDFTADAFQGDMGITSPLRPTEFKNPDNLTDDGKPGVDVSIESIRSRATYLRLLAIPARERYKRRSSLTGARAPRPATPSIGSMRSRGPSARPCSSSSVGCDAPLATVATSPRRTLTLLSKKDRRMNSKLALFPAAA